MPISYEIDSQREIVYCRGAGIVGIEDFTVNLKNRESSPVGHYSLLIDLVGTTTNITGEEMRELVAFRRRLAARVPPAPVAFAADDDHVFAVLRMMQMLTETVRPIGVFRSMEDAEKWLESIRQTDVR